MAEYEYTPLEPGSIRLLKLPERLKDIPNSAPFEIIVLTAQCRDSAIYEALSYVWGNPERSCKLDLAGGKVIPITETLFSALPYLIRHAETGYLWIDQICLNQADDDEKNVQVPLMASVYSGAQRTLVWLGHCDRPLSPHLKTVEKHFEYWRRKMELTPNYVFDASQLGFERSVIFKRLRLMNYGIFDTFWFYLVEVMPFPLRSTAKLSDGSIASYVSRAVIAIADLIKGTRGRVTSFPSGAYAILDELEGQIVQILRNPYFKRTWILQEIWKSSSVSVLLGDYQLRPDTIASVGWVIILCMLVVSGVGGSAHGDVELMDLYDKFTQIFTPNFPSSTHGSAGTKKFSVNLTWYLEWKRSGHGIGTNIASNPVDLVYGIIAACKPSPYLPRVDYKQSVAEVYTSAARYVLQQERSLVVLQLCGNGLERLDPKLVSSAGDELPSWVPNWSRVSATKTFSSGFRYPAPFTASSGMKYESIPSPESDSWRSLRVRGKRVDAIEFLLEPRPYQPTDDGRQRSLDAVWVDMLEMVAQSAAIHSDSPRLLGRVTAPRLLSMALHGYWLSCKIPEATALPMVEKVFATKYEPPKPNALEPQDLRAGVEALFSRTYAATSRRRLCLAPECCEPGDGIFILHGSSVPVVLRQCMADPTRHQFIGVCYLEGAMVGELLDWQEEDAGSFILV